MWIGPEKSPQEENAGTKKPSSKPEEKEKSDSESPLASPEEKKDSGEEEIPKTSSTDSPEEDEEEDNDGDNEDDEDDDDEDDNVTGNEMEKAEVGICRRQLCFCYLFINVGYANFTRVG